MDAMTSLAQIQLTPLKVIRGELGEVRHALAIDTPGFSGFGEAYFSSIHCGAVKAWKKHLRMTLNLVVPVGQIRFVIVDEATLDTAQPAAFEIILSPENYQRLTVPPGLWFGFQGLATGLNLLLNVADVRHDPAEQQSLPADDARLGHMWKAVQAGR